MLGDRERGEGRGEGGFTSAARGLMGGFPSYAASRFSVSIWTCKGGWKMADIPGYRMVDHTSRDRQLHRDQSGVPR